MQAPAPCNSYSQSVPHSLMQQMYRNHSVFPKWVSEAVYTSPNQLYLSTPNSMSHYLPPWSSLTTVHTRISATYSPGYLKFSLTPKSSPPFTPGSGTSQTSCRSIPSRILHQAQPPASSSLQAWVSKAVQYRNAAALTRIANRERA